MGSLVVFHQQPGSVGALPQLGDGCIVEGKAAMGHAVADLDGSEEELGEEDGEGATVGDDRSSLLGCIEPLGEGFEAVADVGVGFAIWWAEVVVPGVVGVFAHGGEGGEFGDELALPVAEGALAEVFGCFAGAICAFGDGCGGDGGAVEVAGEDAVERGVGEEVADFFGLIEATRVEGDIFVSLNPALFIPIGFAVADQEDAHLVKATCLDEASHQGRGFNDVSYPGLQLGAPLLHAEKEAKPCH